MEKRNISISSKNGYTVEKVKLAKKYLDEIGSNKRTFDFKRLVNMYNTILGTSEVGGCKCQSPKYYNGIQNYYNYGKLTLINNGLATEADFEETKEVSIPIENEENRINLGTGEIVSEPLEDVQVDNSKEDDLEATVEAENGVTVDDGEPKEKKKAGRPRKNIEK